MKNKKTDRRSIRTQRLLGEALVSLLLEKRYTTITIQDILDRANIGRSTFYEHYWDKEDLLAGQIEHIVEQLSQQIDPITPPTPAFIPALPLFQHVQEHQHLHQALLRGRGVEVVIQAFQDKLRIYVEQQVRNEHGNTQSGLLIAAVASYIVGSFLNLLQWWLDTDMACSPEEMDALFRNLVIPGVQHIMKQEIMNQK